MIIVKDKRNITRIYINKNIDYFADTYTLILHSMSTNQKYYFEVEDVINYTYYFVFDVDFQDVKSGEYEYELKDNDVKLASGMLKIQDKQVEEITYRSEVKYTTYDPTR